MAIIVRPLSLKQFLDLYFFADLGRNILVPQ